MHGNISVVIPVYNEAGNITSLHSEIVEALARIDGAHEVIYINDGSTDSTLAELKELPGAVIIIDLNRNYGQAVALDAGFRAAQYEYVVSLDGDGQNDPADIPSMFAKLQNDGLDVVAGWRKDRKDSGGINLLTLMGRRLRRFIIKDHVHDTGCTLRVYRKQATDALDIGGEMHRYILALLRWKGFRIGEMVVKHRRRVCGKSKYNYTKAVRGFIDLIFIWFIHKYSQRPLHVFGYVSMVVFASGVLLLGYAAYQKIFLGTGINRSGHFLLGSFSLLTAIILFSFGIVIDFLIRIHLNNSPYEKRYIVRERVEASRAGSEGGEEFSTSRQ